MAITLSMSIGLTLVQLCCQCIHLSSLQSNKWEKYADGVALTSCNWLDLTFQNSIHIAKKILSLTKCMR